MASVSRKEFRFKCASWLTAAMSRSTSTAKRIANAPNARIGRSKEVQFRLNAFSDAHALLGNLRLAAGGKDLYRALNEEGHVTAEGILFDTASDRIRPESEKVLTEISALLVAHPDLKLGIEGHTDNSGADDANQLFRKREPRL